MSADRLRASSQVSLTRWRVCSFRLTLVAVILSSVRCALIALNHRVWISLSVCVRSSFSSSWMTLANFCIHSSWVVLQRQQGRW
ncbi:hypothetical protein F5888DRAFT_1654356 [Russula emetica]|nr:hypothetical protein F5888DRAFT_1752422 [Russula emetica]KAF8506100.1 hypothetical protein F5888DRAFT_1654356 [Russula emetica]